MSTQRGNMHRQKAQKHQNVVKFKNDLHDNSKRTKMLNAMEILGVCRRCKSILEWRITYKKYKCLTVLKTCVKCGQKAVKDAYHTICSSCAKKCGVCAKCGQPADDIQPAKPDATETASNETSVSNMLKLLPERKRRTFQRCVQKKTENEGNDKISKILEEAAKLEKQMDNFCLDDSKSDISDSSNTNDGF